jgi:hypothetical protein
MLVQNTVMTGNNAGSGSGGAISNSGPLTIVDCTIASNTASSDIGSSGGGIDSGGVTTIRDSTIANNAATGLSPPVQLAGAGSGGGGGIAISQTFTLSNCTIFGNSATGGDDGSQPGDGEGGGLLISLSSGQTGLIANCTIAGNHANGGQGSGGVNGNGMGGGIVLGTAGTTNLDNTIVATNTASTADADIDGNVTSGQNNLIGDGTGSNITNGTNANQVGTMAAPLNPELGPLQNNGGPTSTMALLPGSPAIDHGSNVLAPESTDQRGFSRFANGIADIGAFEFQPLVQFPLAVGADLGGAPEVKLYDAATGGKRLDFMAYESTFTGGVRVAVADINGDGVPDIITAPGGVKVTLVNVNGALFPSFDMSAGRAPEIKVFSGVDGSLLDDFIAYTPSFRAGLFVAVADVNGDGKPDIITAPDATGQPGHTQVSVFFNGSLINTGQSLTPDRQFNAYDPGFGGGVRLAAADISGDGFADIVTAPGIWSGPDVRVFDGKALSNSSSASMIGEFLAYDFRYFGGVFVATGDVNGDGHPDIVTGTNGNGGPEVKAFSGSTALGNPTPTIVDDFFAYAPAFNGGARVAVVDVYGHADIVTGAGPGGGPHMRIFDGATGLQLPDAQDSFYAFDPTFSGGVFVGGG